MIMWNLSQRCKDFSISTNYGDTQHQENNEWRGKQDGVRVQKCGVHVSLQMQEYVTDGVIVTEGWLNTSRRP